MSTMTDEGKFSQQDRLDKIAKLIERANRAGSDAEREACLAKADEMMTKYAIDRAFLEANKTRMEKEHPTSIDIDFIRSGEPWFDDFRRLLAEVAESARIRCAVRSGKAFLVGFSDDIEYARMLWSGIYLQFVSRIDPSWNTSLSAEENIKILKEAGRKWGYIADTANAHGFECTANDGRLKAAYRRQCKLEGVEPQSHTQRHEAYRAAFASAFVRTVTWRLRGLREAAEGVVASVPGSAVALRDRFGDVDSRFYEMFPHLRPMTDEELAESIRRMHDLDKAEQARLDAMTPEQRAAEEKRRQREERAAQGEWERRMARRQDAAGKAAGTAAGQAIDLGSEKLGGNARKGIQS